MDFDGPMARHESSSPPEIDIVETEASVPAAGAAPQPAPAAAAPARKGKKEKAPAKKAAAKKKMANGLDREALLAAAYRLKSMSDATRLSILLLLQERPRNVTELCDELGMTSQPAVSHHLALLRASSIVVGMREGKNIRYSLQDTGRQLADLAARFVKG